MGICCCLQDPQTNSYFAIPQAWFSTGDAKPVRDLMLDLEWVNRGEPCANRFLHSNRNLYNPPMQGIPWGTIALGSLLLISARSAVGQEVKSPQPEKSKPPVKMEQRGRILGIGGVFFKSANRDQMREWYAKHLGLADKGGGVMLPWREHDDPQKEHVTVWTVFPASTKYFDPSPAPFMINYIVDDMDALLDRLKQEGVKIDAKRMDESYGRFAWIYDLDGNKIELWQPLPAKP
jgi:catechol 2,3-dioxygenase-like lactoylglutathione lyase family enzyme